MIGTIQVRRYRYQDLCTYDAVILFSMTFPQSRCTSLDTCKVEGRVLLVLGRAVSTFLIRMYVGMKQVKQPSMSNVQCHAFAKCALQQSCG